MSDVEDYAQDLETSEVPESGFEGETAESLIEDGDDVGDEDDDDDDGDEDDAEEQV